MSSDTSGKPTITGLVLTYNGERLLGKCLESLAFCDAVIVVDSFSSDATESIAREHGATFVQHPWSGALPQLIRPRPRRNRLGGFPRSGRNLFGTAP